MTALPHAAPASDLPIPVLDHVIVNARDGLESAAAQYRRLGFTLTPQGRHKLGSVNHLAMLGTDYFELIGVPPEGAPATDIMDWPAGLLGLVFNATGAPALQATLAAAGAPVGPVHANSRPVALPGGGSEDASFRVIPIHQQAAPAGWMFFCEHLTRDLVWQNRWRRHANGALAVSRLTMTAADPQQMAALFATLFGPHAVTPQPGGIRLALGLSSADVLHPEEARRRYGGALPAPDGRSERMVAVTLRTASLAQTAAALRAGEVPFVEGEGWLRVAAAEACGTLLEFCE